MNTRKRAVGLALAALVTIVSWQVPGGRYVLYPFTILATWFHEMGHGLCAMLLGGTFVGLHLWPDGSGYAVYSGAESLGRFGTALVAAAGPLGPAVAGSLLILVSLRRTWSLIGLASLALGMLLSAIAWIRGPFGLVLIALMAVLLLAILINGSSQVRSLTLQFVGVQACISVFSQVGYLFTERVMLPVGPSYSDTGQMAAVLLLPYWFWATLLTGLTLGLPAWSLRRALSAR